MLDHANCLKSVVWSAWEKKFSPLFIVHCIGGETLLLNVIWHTCIFTINPDWDKWVQQLLKHLCYLELIREVVRIYLVLKKNYNGSCLSNQERKKKRTGKIDFQFNRRKMTLISSKPVLMQLSMLCPRGRTTGWGVDFDRLCAPHVGNFSKLWT